MRWEELTGDDFAAAVEKAQGVCLVALSVIERHGHHLPTGTDMFTGRAVLDRAAALEPAVVFPDYYFTQIPEARHHPGTISIDGDLMLRLLDNVCREVARNGLKKVVLVSAHGGNRNLMPFFGELQLYSPRDYAVYLVNPIRPEVTSAVELPWPRSAGGHAGPGETSHILAVRPELVHLDRIVEGEGESLNRLRHLKEAGVQTSIWWYADQPYHYQGDASYATAEAGEALLSAQARYVAEAIRAIKADTATLRLQEEFYSRSRAPKG